MTTDELVQNVIDQFLANDGMLGAIDEFVRIVAKEEFVFGTFVTYSVALNNETFDVRYVRVRWDEERDEFLAAVEVFPVTVVKTEYREK